ncbi:MAG: dTDP-4-dehydrorhamnose 3,5-epimerase [Balneolaceae bacterium]|nr:dTDP-4-dehydrorhamnose 3,5-epimerase [Balneolaceae bacterium]
MKFKNEYMEFEQTEIEDVLLLKPDIFRDRRGIFLESYRKSLFRERGLNIDFVQDNISSSKKGAIRGLHYQIENPQDKLIMVMQGKILDVAVDLRRSSPTFGKNVTRIISEENRHQLFIPKGFAHGFAVLSDETLVYYKCSDYYNPEGERGLFWNDPALGIDWKVTDPVISDKDRHQPNLNEIPKEDLFN